MHKFEILKYRKYDFLIFFYLASFVIQVENRIVDRMCVKFATFSLSKSYIANVDYKNVVGRYITREELKNAHEINQMSLREFICDPGPTVMCI